MYEYFDFYEVFFDEEFVEFKMNICDFVWNLRYFVCLFFLRGQRWIKEEGGGGWKCSRDEYLVGGLQNEKCVLDIFYFVFKNVDIYQIVKGF